MNKFGTAALAAIAAAALATAASAAVVTNLGDSDQGAGNTAGIGFAVGYGADTPNGASWADGTAPVVTPPPGNSSGLFQSPFNSNGLTDTQDYFSVDVNGVIGGPGSETLVYGAAQTSFTLLWGSIDSYNTLSFDNGYSIDGSGLVALLGLGGTPINFEDVALVNFNFAGQEGAFSQVTFSTTQNAFEFALAPVPLPAAAWMLLAAVGGLGSVAARRRRGA